MNIKKYICLSMGIIGVILINLVVCNNNIKAEKITAKSESLPSESLDDIPPNIIDNIAPDADQKIKSEIKDFHVENRNGEEVYLSQFVGKPIVINFWASYCEPCKEDMPYFMEAIERYGSEVEFLMINLTDGTKETKESAEKFLSDNNFNINTFFDNHLEATIAYNVTSLPRTIFISKDGYVQKSVKGMMNDEYLEELIGRIL